MFLEEGFAQATNEEGLYAVQDVCQEERAGDHEVVIVAVLRDGLVTKEGKDSSEACGGAYLSDGGSSSRGESPASSRVSDRVNHRESSSG